MASVFATKNIVAQKKILLSVIVLTLLLMSFGFYLIQSGRGRRHNPHEGEIFTGVRYECTVRKLPRLLRVHYIIVDLKATGLQFLVTPPDHPKAQWPLYARRTSEFLQESGTQVAINGDFFFPYHPRDHEAAGVEGYASSRGVAYGFDETRWSHPTLCISRTNQVTICRMHPGKATPYNAIGGDRWLLQNGQVTAAAKLDQKLQPRSAVGIDRNGKFLIMVVVDGRQPGFSEGVTLEELANLLRDKGVYDALNFDGGGSCTLAVQGKDGRPEVWNSPIHRWIVGNERPVGNHLALFALPLKRKLGTE